MKKLNVHNIIPVSEVNGPGRRFCIWVQGCPFSCPGCFNQKARERKTSLLVSPGELAERIEGTKGIEGISISGGEPFMQAKALCGLVSIVRRKGMSVLVYTGYTYDVLKRSHDRYTRELLSMTDILVDGPFMKDIPSSRLWTGSGNQKVRFLTQRYADWDKKIRTVRRKVEIIIMPDGTVHQTGFRQVL